MANMRERYETISLADLKEMAKFRGIKGVSAMKKADIIEAMVAKDEEESAAGSAGAAAAGGDAQNKPVAFAPQPMHRSG